MINRIDDPDAIRTALARYPYEPIELDVDEWLRDNRVTVYDEDGDIGILEEFIPGVYSAHWFYERKGKAAKELAIRMLRQGFNDLPMTMIRGLTPKKHRAAVIMTSMLGLKSYGDVDTPIGPCVLFMMSRDEFKDKYGL